jgi:CheY-like chemotaxis protein
MTDSPEGKILLLDDDTFVIDIYKEKFTEKGFLVQTSRSVDEALRILRGGFVPDAILFDLEMKEKDGFAFLQALKDEHLAEGAYRMALTNHDEDEKKTKALAMGTTAYVIKVEMIPDEVLALTLAAIHKA